MIKKKKNITRILGAVKRASFQVLTVFSPPPPRTPLLIPITRTEIIWAPVEHSVTLLLWYNGTDASNHSHLLLQPQKNPRGWGGGC